MNYDHTILGWRSAVNLQPYLSDRRAALPATQAMWYVPQGLNIWDQIQCEFPGHLAREQEKCDGREPAGSLAAANPTSMGPPGAGRR